MDALAVAVVVPGVLGLVALALPRRSGVLHPLLGVLGTLATLVGGASLARVPQGVAGPAFSFAGFEVHLALRADAFSGWAVAFVGLLGFATTLYAAGFFRGRGPAPGRYHAWVLLATAGAAVALLADDLLLLLVGWEVVTASLFLLVIASREDGGPGAAKAFTLLGLGDLALLVGIVLVGLAQRDLGAGSAWSIEALRRGPLAAEGPLATWAWILLFVAAAAKAGAMPFHTWIPTLSTGTHAAVMAFLPGALDKVLGIYLLTRISLDWFVPSPTLGTVVMTVGAVTILGANLVATGQQDLRRLLSYCAVAQVGYMLLGIGTGTAIGVIGGVFHMVNHAVYKACLFLGAGSVERETGTADLGRLGGSRGRCR